MVWNLDRDYCWTHRHDEEIIVASTGNWLKELVGPDTKYRVDKEDSNK
jgi:hypothetical protein